MKRWLSIMIMTFVACPAAVALAETSFPHGQFDIAGLTRENFYKVIIPRAKAEGKVVFYGFAGNFGPTWTEGLFKRFQKKYGITVEYTDVREPLAVQQLIAVTQRGQDAPMDVYFTGGGNFPILSAAGAVAPVDLGAILPNLASVPPEFKDMVFGYRVSGRFLIVHRNQTAIGYDSARIAETDVPRDFDALLDWSIRNPKKFAVTIPDRGGSGSGFLFSVAMNYLKGECLDKLLDETMTRSEADDWTMSTSCLDPVWDYFAKLIRSAELTDGNADTLNLINDGQVTMGTVWEDLSFTFIRRKLLPSSFRLTLLKNGEVGAGDALFVPTNAIHPAAALLLVDMAFGLDFQAYKLSTKASRSPRPDLDPAGTVPADMRPYLLPDTVYPRLSHVRVNWPMAHSLARALDEKVLLKP